MVERSVGSKAAPQYSRFVVQLLGNEHCPAAFCSTHIIMTTKESNGQTIQVSKYVYINNDFFLEPLAPIARTVRGRISSGLLSPSKSRQKHMFWVPREDRNEIFEISWGRPCHSIGRLNFESHGTFHRHRCRPQ